MGHFAREARRFGLGMLRPMFDSILTTENLIALATLTAMETVLGIDNIVFLAILVGRLPPNQRDRARQVGLTLAVVTRIALVLGITWIMGLKAELFSVMGHAMSGKDLVLLGGGLFLIAKSTHEIHSKVEDAERPVSAAAVTYSSFAGAIVQILVMDCIFSLDSVITAVGMAKSRAIMIAAIVVSIGIMLAFSGYIVRFVDRHPTIKVLALSFLILIGVMLVAESFGQSIPKGYIYFAMAFSLGVEMVNLRLRSKSQPAEAGE